MYLLHSFYYSLHTGTPEAIPAAIAAFQVSDYFDLDDDADAVFELMNGLDIKENYGDCGITEDNYDLIFKEYGDAGCGYVFRNQFVYDWMWENIRKQPHLKYHELDVVELLGAMFVKEESN